MILIDFNSLLFQYTHSCISILKLKPQENGKYNINDFITQLKTFLLNELFNIQKTHINYGNIVLCIDNTVGGNWRKNIFKDYKKSRTTLYKDKSNPIPFYELFTHISELIKNISLNTSWKVVSVENAEADDCILCLANAYKNEQILIISSDKDMIQAQKNPNVKQFSPLLKKYINYSTKDTSSLDEWILEHVILGDAADDIPRIFDNTEYTKTFKEFLQNNNLSTNEKDFENLDDNTIEEFSQKYPKENIWIKQRIGTKTIQKMIRNNTIHEFISKYKDNYERNKLLILGENIPKNIQENIIKEFSKEKCITEKSTENFIDYLTKENMFNVISNLPFNFVKKEVTIDDFL